MLELLSGQAVIEAKDYKIMDWDEMQEAKKVSRQSVCVRGFGQLTRACLSSGTYGAGRSHRLTHENALIRVSIARLGCQACAIVRSCFSERGKFGDESRR